MSFWKPGFFSVRKQKPLALELMLGVLTANHILFPFLMQATLDVLVHLKVEAAVRFARMMT